MPEVVIPYERRDAFRAYHAASQRFKAIAVHRRGGKTIAMVNQHIKYALEDPVIQLAKRGIKPVSLVEAEGWRKTPRLHSIIYPSLKQAKGIAWGPLKYYTEKIPGIKSNEQELSITLPNKGVIRLFGAGPTERDSFRGLKQWSVAFDENQDHDPITWHEMVRPSCIDTQAPVEFLGTIKGKNHHWRLFEEHKDDPHWYTLFLPASRSGILAPEILQQERSDYERAGKLNKYLQEYELEPMAIIEGAVFGKEYNWLKENGRIGMYDHDPALRVDTFWDLGIADYLVVLFFQRVNGQARIIDCIATHSTSIPDVARQLLLRPYLYGTHHLPHDAKARDLITGVTREYAVKTYLVGDVRVVQRVPHKGDALSALRAVYRRLFISEKLDQFVDAFAQYEYERDERRNVYLDAPKHNWCSHYVDALLLWAQLEFAESGPLNQGPTTTTQSTANDIHAPI